MQKKSIPKGDLYEKKRYWYHISTTLNKKNELLEPRSNDEGFNRTDGEPDIKRICVSPTLEQCLVAVPYSKWDEISVYKTKEKVIARKSRKVFDSSITQEGWITISTPFVRVGSLNMARLEKTTKIERERATFGCLDLSKILYKWWVKIDPWKFVEKD